MGNASLARSPGRGSCVQSGKASLRYCNRTSEFADKACTDAPSTWELSISGKYVLEVLRVLAVFRALILRVLLVLRVFRAFILSDTSILAVFRGSILVDTPCTGSILGFDTLEYCLYSKVFRGLVLLILRVLAGSQFSEYAQCTRSMSYTSTASTPLRQFHPVFWQKNSQTVPRVLVGA